MSICLQWLHGGPLSSHYSHVIDQSCSEALDKFQPQHHDFQHTLILRFEHASQALFKRGPWIFFFLTFSDDGSPSAAGDISADSRVC